MFLPRLLAFYPGELGGGGVVALFLRQFRDPMRVRGGVLQFRGALVILIMRSMITSCGHDSPFTAAGLTGKTASKPRAIG
jgi:hypothetical protein